MTRITSFDFEPGTLLADKYEVLDKVGDGWEGEVFRVRERGTGVTRAAKIFYPYRNKRGMAARFTARKLHKLRTCGILTQYHTQEKIFHEEQECTLLVSEFVDGMILKNFLREQRGKKLTLFEALHLLYALADGVRCIHAHKEYHGDIHYKNIIVKRRGIGFDVKLIDAFNHGRSSAHYIGEDVVDLIKIFYDCIGGKQTYANMPSHIKYLVAGNRRSTIKKRFKNAGALKHHLETFTWE